MTNTENRWILKKKGFRYCTSAGYLPGRCREEELEGMLYITAERRTSSRGGREGESRAEQRKRRQLFSVIQSINNYRDEDMGIMYDVGRYSVYVDVAIIYACWSSGL